MNYLVFITDVNYFIDILDLVDSEIKIFFSDQLLHAKK